MISMGNTQARLTRLTNKAADIAFFFQRVIAAPRRMGAIVPSSKKLADCMAEEALKTRKRTQEFIVEVGAGTGCMTASLLEKGLPPSKLISVELDRKLCNHMHQRFPNIQVIHGNALHLPKLVAPQLHGQVSAIVSSIPMLLFSTDERAQLFKAYFDVLKAEGQVVQYTYGHKSPNTMPDLHQQRVNRIYMNLPPCSVWVYRRATAAQVQI